MDTETDYTEEVICPYCGEVQSNSFEYDDGEYDCDDCGEPFFVVRNIEITYSTAKLDHACMQCGKKLVKDGVCRDKDRHGQEIIVCFECYAEEAGRKRRA